MRAFVLAFAVSSVTLLGQAPTGNIVGRVTDSTGSLVPGVEVVALNPAKNIQTRATTDTEGMYRLLYLDPASYIVTFISPGFRTLRHSGVELRSNETLSLDGALTVGEVVEKVEVTGAAPLLEAVTSTTGTVILNKQINTLPNTQRKVWQLIYLMPGATGMNGYHISGQRERGMAYTMDGLSGLEPVRGGIDNNRVVSTSQDAIEEVKLVTTVLPAEFGHSAGGMLSATYKSGTNQLHMLAEDRYVNNSLKHRDFFQLERANTPFVYHELSGLVSGPVVIPKVYDGRNKTFFLYAIARHHEKNDQQLFADVPTPEMLNGDFSFNGLGYPIYDPTTTRKDATGKWIRDPFPRNLVPTSRFDPVARKFLGFQPWKEPNNLGGAGYIDRVGPHQNYGAYNHKTSYRTRWDAKVDHNFSEKDRMFGRYSQSRNRGVVNNIALNWQLIDGGFVETPSDQLNAVISETHIFNSNLINEVRLGSNHRKQSRTPGGYNEDWGAQLGIPGISPVGFPGFFDSKGAAFYTATMPGAASYEVTESYTLQDNLTSVRGRHTLKAGYELMLTRANTMAASLPSGTYRFGGTDMPFTPNTGNDFAGFLLGSVMRADFNTTLATWLPRWRSHAAYIQDDWRVTPRLTLNLGLRWSHESPFRTKHDQHSQFDPTAVDPVSGRLGAITHPKTALARRDLLNFQPRAGAAYRLSQKMALRAGFGLSTMDLFVTALEQNFEEYFTSVTRQSVSGDPTPVFYISKGPGAVNYDVLPNGTSPFQGVNYSGRTATWYDPGMRSPYSMNWNATWQYEFAPTWLLDASYQGSAGVGLLNSWDVNAIPLDVSRDRAVLDRIYQDTQSYKPFTNFGSVRLWSNFAHSTYHSATVKVEKRFSRGLILDSFYTRSKAIGEADDDSAASGITYYNRRLEKGRTNFDISNRWVTHAVYELPVGHGRRWMNRGGVFDYVLGGWNIALIQTFQSGTPVTFTMGGSPNRYLPGTQRPIQNAPNSEVIVQNYQLGDRFNNNLKNPMWNIKGFAYPAAYTPGTVGRNTIDGPAVNWTQASVAKNFKFREKYNLDVRFDAQNIFKTPNYKNPNSVVNLTNPSAFGKPTATVSGIDSLGGRFVGYFMVKLSFSMIPTRRGFLAGMPALAGLSQKSGAERPNFLFILTDDQRWDSLGAAGHPVLKTPGMDRIAREGARFANAFCTTSLCSPSRASFLTGCYARRHGVKDNSTPLPPNTPTFGSLLGAAGYQTAHIGKWHMDGMLERPGFDFSVTFQGQGTYTDPPLRFNGEERKVQGYLTDLLTDYAAEWLERPRQAPFCMYFGHKACHLPVVPAERHRNAFPDAKLPVPASASDTLEGKPEWVKKRGEGKTGVANHPNYDLNHRNYLRTLLAVDDSVARLLELLERKKLLDSTVVVFAGDNGFFHGEHGLTNKRAMYEEAIRIPFLLRYPRLARAGTVVNEMALNIDMAPTFLELAGVKAPARMQGRSLAPLLAGRERALRESFLYEYYREESFADTPSIEGLRTRRWKYIRYPGTKEIEELYDLQADPRELHNLAGEAAPQAARMREQLEALLRTTAP